MGLTVVIAPPPATLSALQARAETLSHMTLSELAQHVGCQVPDSLKYAKGWVGELLEAYLGADAGNHARPDFTQLNIELKSLPLNTRHKPQESTYVCTLPLSGRLAAYYENSTVAEKLTHVLWVPVEADSSMPLGNRRIKRPFFWQPSAIEFAQLKTDWEEITEFVLTGQIDQLDASIGTYLHIRPKAMNAKALTTTIDHTGAQITTLPRGFYLRSAFTATLLT